MLCAGAAGLSHGAGTERVPLMSPLRLGRGTVTTLIAGVLQESVGRSLGGSGAAQPQFPATRGTGWLQRVLGKQRGG